jgi:hypothetical protein
MARLTARDVTTILQFLEHGIRLIPKTNRAQKMAAGSRIRRQFSWPSQPSALTAWIVLNELDQRLADLFHLYPIGSKEKLTELVKEKLEGVSLHVPLCKKACFPKVLPALLFRGKWFKQINWYWKEGL